MRLSLLRSAQCNGDFCLNISRHKLDKMCDLFPSIDDLLCSIYGLRGVGKWGDTQSIFRYVHFCLKDRKENVMRNSHFANNWSDCNCLFDAVKIY